MSEGGGWLQPEMGPGKTTLSLSLRTCLGVFIEFKKTEELFELDHEI